jgi:hypothetical protein
MRAVTLVKTCEAVFRQKGKHFELLYNVLVKESKIPSALWMDGYVKILISEIH